MRSAITGRLSRRRLLRSGAALGLGATALALVGCGEDEPEPTELQVEQSQQQAQPQQEQALPPQQQAQEQAELQSEEEQAAPPSPARGGILRTFLPIERFDSWDPHRSRYRYAQSVHSLVYSRLLQPADPHSGELAPDLCSLPETPDSTTYVFRLDRGAHFWDQPPTDGRSVGIDDIRLNIERQQQGLDAEGEPDPQLYRSRDWQRAAFAAGEDDSFTLSTSEPDAPFLAGTAASPFAWIVSTEAIEDSAPGWLSDQFDHTLVSGSGPYLPTAYDTGSELSLERSANWWGASEAWPDGITFFGGAVEEMVSAYNDARTDLADFPLFNVVIERMREEHPEHAVYELPLDAPVQLIAALDSDPSAALSDPRLINALTSVIDRHQLIERLYNGHGRPSGPLPWYLEGWALADDQLAGFPGYRADREEDLQEAAELIAAAGGADVAAPVPFVVADLFEGFFPGAGPFLQDQIQQATGLTLDIEYRPFAESLSRLAEGGRFLFLGWGETPRGPDPTDRWRETLHSAGADNWGALADPEVDSLIEQMRATFDLDARRDLARQTQERLLSAAPTGWQHNLINGIQLGLSQPWVHPDPRIHAYAWSTQYLASSWIDTSESSGYPAEMREPPEPEPAPEAPEIEASGAEPSKPETLELDAPEPDAAE